MVNTVKFSDFDVADINDSTTENVGLSSGVNTREDKFYRWTTGTRPATPFNGLLGLNTTLQQYEFWDSDAGLWTQFADSNVFAVLASHTAGQGASLIGLQDQSNVTSKFVQDLANSTFIAQTSNGSLQNAQYLGSLTTGIVKNTTVTGALSISAPLTSIDGLTTVLGNILYVSAPNTYVNLAGNITSAKQFLSQTGTGVISAAPVWATVSAGDIVSPAALTKTDDTNVTLTLGGSPTVALLAATSLTLGWTGTLSSTRGGLGLSNPTAHGILVGEGSSAVNPILLSSGQILIGSTGADPVAAAINSGTSVLVANGAGSITVSLAPIAANNILSNITAGSAAPIANTLTATIDAAIGSTQGNILYRNSSVWTVLAPGTSGTFLQTQGADANPQWAAQSAPTGAALTKTDDTNVTLTLGGSPTVALLAATSLTLGWTGQLGLTRGGTAASLTASNGGIVYSTASALAILSGTATAQQLLLSGASTTPQWSTTTYPLTNAINTIMYASSANVQGVITPANSSILVSGVGGIPAWSTTLPAFITSSITFNPTTGGIVGTTTNDSAAAGKVGEIISSEVLIGSPVSISSNVAKDITTISLTAGQWNVFANIGIVGAAGTTVDTMIGCINTSTAIAPASRRAFVAYGVSYAIGAGDIEAVVPSQPMQLSGTTTIHLVIQSQFNVSTMSAFGFMWAVRAR